ncbi:MAG: hypothetical protein WA151_03655 [Desulfatirhabdiaceae bacterium]
MAKVFRPSTRESSILSKIESSKDHMRKTAIYNIRDHIDELANAIATKLIENNFVETGSKKSLEDQVHGCLEKLSRAEDFDIDYQCAPFRGTLQQPNVVSLYITAFIIEQLIHHKDIIDIFGSDEDIYVCVNKQVIRYLS